MAETTKEQPPIDADDAATQVIAALNSFGLDASGKIDSETVGDEVLIKIRLKSGRPIPTEKDDPKGEADAFLLIRAAHPQDVWGHGLWQAHASIFDLKAERSTAEGTRGGWVEWVEIIGDRDEREALADPAVKGKLQELIGLGLEQAATDALKPLLGSGTLIPRGEAPAAQITKETKRAAEPRIDSWPRMDVAGAEGEAKVEEKPKPAPTPPMAEPAKVEPAKVEPAKVEPAKVEPAKVEPAKVEPAKIKETAEVKEKAEPPTAKVETKPPEDIWAPSKPTGPLPRDVVSKKPTEVGARAKAPAPEYARVRAKKHARPRSWGPFIAVGIVVALAATALFLVTRPDEVRVLRTGTRPNTEPIPTSSPSVPLVRVNGSIRMTNSAKEGGRLDCGFTLITLNPLESWNVRLKVEGIGTKNPPKLAPGYGWNDGKVDKSFAKANEVTVIQSIKKAKGNYSCAIGRVSTPDGPAPVSGRTKVSTNA